MDEAKVISARDSDLVTREWRHVRNPAQDFVNLWPLHTAGARDYAFARGVSGQRRDIYAAPLQATLDQLKGLPPTLIQVAGNDVP